MPEFISRPRQSGKNRETPFVVETFNAHDRGVPSPAHLIHVTERPSIFVLQGALPTHRWFYPSRSSDAIGYDSIRYEQHGTRLIHAWRSGRHHGKPGTTPEGYVLSWWGQDRVTGEKTALVGSHLVNNAFGPILRGERPLRLKLWHQGRRAMRREAQRLRRLGYTVIPLGDLNRRPRWWPKILDRSVGAGYDRIIVPPALEVLRTWRGKRQPGVDHLALLVELRRRASN